MSFEAEVAHRPAEEGRGQDDRIRTSAMTIVDSLAKVRDERKRREQYL